MKHLKLSAQDTLFFRDGKPFTMGEDDFGASLFPPAPSVSYGLLRSLWFAEDMGRFRHANSDQDGSMGLDLSYMHLLTEQVDRESTLVSSEVLLPVPVDISMERSGQTFSGAQETEVSTGYSFLKEVDFVGSYPAHYILSSPLVGKLREMSGSYAPASLITNYLKGTLELDELKPAIVDLQDVLTKETKIGLGRAGNTRTAQEGRLYAIEMERPEKIGKDTTQKLSFLLGYEGLDLHQLPAMCRMGGEGKTVRASEANAPFMSHLPAPDVKGAKFLKMYLATPGIFSRGWRPELPEDVDIIAASLAKPAVIGGFDMVKREPKPMLKAVPAGSVYFLHGEADILRKLADRFHGRSICKPVNTIDYSKQGFGQVFFAHCHPSQLQNLKPQDV